MPMTEFRDEVLEFEYLGKRYTNRDGAMFLLNQRAEAAGKGRPFTTEHMNNLANDNRLPTTRLESDRVYDLEIVRTVSLDDLLPKSRPTYSEEQKNRALDLRAEGKSVGSIAQELGIARSTIQRWLNE